jgi:hypothetical protein
MKSQTTQRVIMVRPFGFSSNSETLADNFFQSQLTNDRDGIEIIALQEFEACVNTLKAHQIDVLVLEPLTPELTPDAVFPNNWFSISHEGTLCVYPMANPSRRAEIRPQFDEELRQMDISIACVQDWTRAVSQNQFLEGTGSLVLDHQFGLAYVAISNRSHLELAKQWCARNNYQICPFETVHNEQQIPVYHTNVVMSVGHHFAVVCLDAIHPNDKDRIYHHLTQSDRQVIAISLEQMNQFAGNILELKNQSNQPIIAMSQTAFNAFEKLQISELERFGGLAVCDIPTIEKYGGGSLRCMLAEVFI